MNLEQLAGDIPHYQRYLTVDELNASTHQLVQAFPELVKTKIVGKTGQGDPVELITIGGGPRRAFVFGAPDPEEPVGCMMIEFLSRRLCLDEEFRRELGYTWHFVKAIEADGMRRNEAWFKGPFTVSQYARHVYRGWVSDKADYAFPVEYKRFKFDRVLPETKILMAVMDEVQPHFMYALHNGKFGGVWYDVSRPCGPLYKQFETIPEWFGMTINRGETEGGQDNEVASAVYCNQQTFSEWYDEMEEKGHDPVEMRSWGISSRAYAQRYNTFGLIVEVPFWNDPSADDLTPTNILFGKVVLRGLESMDVFVSWARNVLQSVQDELHLNSPIRNFVEKIVWRTQQNRTGQYEWAQSSEKAARPATRAEVFSNTELVLIKQTVLSGMMARIMSDEIESGNPSQKIVQVRDTAWMKLAGTNDLLEASSNYQALPIRNLVGVQLCAGLATAEYLRDCVNIELL